MFKICCIFVLVKKYLYTGSMLLLGIVVILPACRKENTEKAVEFYYSYYPIIKGAERIYDVTFISIDDSNKDTTRYQLKETFESEFLNNTGTCSWRLERYKRTDSLQNWVIADVWEAQVSDGKAFQIEENLRLVKLIFPVKSGASWDGNSHNSLDYKKYHITAAHNPLISGAFSFDSTVTVTSDDYETLISKYHSYEVYANHTGLINKVSINIDNAFTGLSTPIEQRIKRGTLYYQTLIKYQFNE